jgi:hypothetical protein
MVSETRTLIEMTDIVGIEFACRKCGAKILYPLAEHYNRLSEKCPNCYEPWFTKNVAAHSSAETAADEVKKIFATLHKVATSPEVLAQVRLSISGVAKAKLNEEK